MRKAIQIKGISTTSAYEDGECLSIMNVRHEQGVLKPVENFPIDFELAYEYSHLYWHKNNDYQHLIGVRGGWLYWLYEKVETINKTFTVISGSYSGGQTTLKVSSPVFSEMLEGDKLVSINGIEQPPSYIVTIDPDFDEITFSGDVTHGYFEGIVIVIETHSTRKPLLEVGQDIKLSHIGNILNVLDGTVLKYIFWEDNKYLVINTAFDGEQTDTELSPVKIDLKVDGVQGLDIVNWVGSDRDEVRAYRSDVKIDIGQGISDINQKFVSNIYNGLYKKAVAGLQEDGLLSGCVIAVAVVELFDGSYIKVSNEVVLGQAFDVQSRYVVGVGGVQYDYINSKAVFNPLISIGSANLLGIRNTLNNDTVLHSNGYVTSINVSTKAFKPNSTTDTVSTDTIGIPNFLGYYRNDNTNSGLVNQYPWLLASYNKIKFKIKSENYLIYKDIIKSISVFISPEVSMYKTDDANDIYSFVGYVSTKTPENYSTRVENYLPQVKTNAEIIEELSKVENFYKVHTIPFDSIINNGWVTIDLKGKLGDNLFTQERLKLDAFSNIKAKSQMTYNSMLHAWDINNIIGRGYPVNYFYPIQGIGQFSGTVGSVEEDVQGWIEYMSVKIKTDIGLSEVIRITPELNIRLKVFNLSPMLSYPDSRATEMTLYRSYYDAIHGVYREQKKVFKLTSSDTGNYAYYISPDLKPISCTEFNGVFNVYKAIPAESNQELRYQNKLKVSNVNNPFLFPDAQTYQVGDGAILNVGSQSIRTSDGQFGQYPLICFCTDGIFSLEVGDGTVAYSKAVKPQSYERPISSVICTTPFGIAFISNRGLCMVAGQEVISLSEPMFEKFRDINLELPTAIENSFDMDMGSFNDYLKRCTAMIYNPKEQELIIINPYKLSNYVYNFKSKQFYRNDELITNEINNSLPSLQVWNGTTVKNVTSSNSGSRSVSFVTRPIKIQTTDLKRFERVIVRAVLKEVSGSPATTCIWGSNDDINFKLLRGLTITNGTTRKDIDFGMFGKTTYRSYIVGLSMTLTTDSEIEVIEMEIEKLYNNTKMR